MQINCCEDAAERVAGRDRRAGRAPVRGTGLRLRQHGFTAHSFVLACQSQQLDLPLRFRHQSILTGQRGFWRRGYRNDEHFLNHHMGIVMTLAVYSVLVVCRQKPFSILKQSIFFYIFILGQCRRMVVAPCLPFVINKLPSSISRLACS